jgi:deoxycytidine triphosphate deaminase
MVDVDTDVEGTDHVIIPPNSFALCETVESSTSRAMCS